jgi:histidinol-phosphate/aromatic aminotransferase/cobyric acid decarboxylase-like protein
LATTTAYNVKVLECPLSLVLSEAVGVVTERSQSVVTERSQSVVTERSRSAASGREVLVTGHWSLFLDKGQRTNDKGLLLNNPHNPTGKLFSRDSILPYLEQFALVVVDEAFMDFVPPNEEQSLIPVVQEYANLVILRSLTKFYSLPGLRLGYAIAHPDCLAKWQLWRDPWPVNTLAAAAAIAALQDTEFQQQTWAWLPPARNQLFQGLAEIPGLQPQASAANFLLVESQKSTSQLQRELLQHHQILIRDCLSFKELGDRFFRVAVREESDNQRLLIALDSVLSEERCD